MDTGQEENTTGRFSCELCGKIIFSTKAVRIHMEQVHNYCVRGGCCEICSKKLDKQPEPSALQILCELCKTMNKGRNEASDLANDRKMVCRISKTCGRFCKTYQAFHTHAKTHDVDVHLYFKCHLCYSSFNDIESLSNHRQSVHEGELSFGHVIKCEMCEETFETVTKYKEHYIEEHSMNGADDIKLICAKCKAVFLEKKFFTYHQIGHECMLYKCHACHTMLKNMNSMRAHIRKKHKDLKQ